MTVSINMAGVNQKVQDVMQAQAELIALKASARTTKFAEQYGYGKAVAPKTEQVLAFEKLLATPDSGVYHNAQALALFNALSGGNAEMPRQFDVTFDRAVVVVPVSTPDQKWDEKIEGKPLICVHMGRSAFRDANGEKYHLEGVNGAALRPATDAEIQAVIEGQFNTAKRGFEFVKNLGDSKALAILEGESALEA